jgi:hypothetical protein
MRRARRAAPFRHPLASNSMSYRIHWTVWNTGPNGLEPLGGWVSVFRSDCGIKRIAALAHTKVPSSS